MEKNFYTPMEQILITAAKKLTTKEIVESAKKTKQDSVKALEADLLLLELEEQVGLMDGLTVKEWAQ